MEKVVAQIIVPNYIRQVEVSKPRKPKLLVYKDGVLRSGKRLMKALTDALTDRKKYCLGLLHKDGTKTLLMKFTPPDNVSFQNEVEAVIRPMDITDYKHKVRISGIKWIVSDKLCVFDMTTGLPVITNAQTVGTPKYVSVNANVFYAGTHHHVRNIVVNAVKEQLKAAIAKANVVISSEDYPVQVQLTVVDNIDSALNSGVLWDLDNRAYLYKKVFYDVLRDTVLPDDNIRYIAAETTQFIPLDMYDDPGIIEPTLIFDIIKIGGGVQEYIREVFS